MHRVTNIRPDDRRGDCAVCGPDVRLKYRKSRNYWACLTSESRRRPGAGRDYDAKRTHFYGPGYSLSREEFAALNESQGGVCAVCGGPNRNGRRLVIDHCHAELRVRGLLCDACNKGLGFMRDDPARLRRAAEYLSQ